MVRGNTRARVVMNAAYFNAGPGERMLDLMFYECADMREHPDGEEIDALHDYLDEAECEDDIDDAYDRERERDYEDEEDYD
jgi:hypothetical protein